MPEPDLVVCHLGLVEYRDAAGLQARLRAAREAEECGDLLLLLEHPPVYTRGRRSGADELPMGEAWYLAQGIDVVDTDRGGRVTYHGPGQLVVYPILRVDDVVAHVRTMERAVIAALAGEGIAARARAAKGPDYTGVWVEDRKIASIGVHMTRGIATHGLAVNVENDLQPFEWIVPCGLQGVRMTSVRKELRAQAAGILPRFGEATVAALSAELGRAARTIAPEELRVAALPSRS